MPAVARPGILSVGSDLAVTAGAVVHRHPMYELIQYSPQTNRVRAVPLLVVASPINKYYFLDLAPGRSLIEYAVRRGIQCFAISWRNPTAAQRDWTLASYADAVDDASRVIAAISRSDETNVVGVCAGGSITAAWLGARAARHETRTPATTMLVAGIDTSWPSLFGALATRGTIAASLRRARRNGVFGGRDISRTFAWSRPNELVWNLWVHNYLLGHEPPTTDILAWNADLTNLPAGLHADLIRILADNSLAEPGGVAVGGTPVDLAKIDSDVYVLGALADHIVPWQACYQSAQLFTGHTRFVAASGGHIQSLVNPPGNPRSRYRTGDDDLPDDPEMWMRSATEHAGTWWDDWLDWLEARSGATKAAPARLGARSHPPLGSAPGRYVHQRAAA
jgi:polyhydroxyalkanoate synthase